MAITCDSIQHISNNFRYYTICCIRIGIAENSYLSHSKHPLYRCFLEPDTSKASTFGEAEVGQSRIENPLFTPSLPLATKMLPPRPTRWKAQAPTRHNLTRRLCNLHLPKPQAPPTRYAWLATGLQTSSSSNRRRKDANASSPRLKLPPVFSPQWAQHEPTASQSARFVSSPQDLH
jgi:hypothetical protein